MIRRLTLAQRLSATFAILLLACSGISIGLQIHSSARHEQALAQQLSRGLADHIAGTAQLMDASGWRPDAVRGLFDKLMAVNPSVEVYLLDKAGRIVGDAAPPGHIKRQQVDLTSVRQFLAGAPLPIFGDDPRSGRTSKVFSAAPVQVDGRQAGYVYIILQSEERDALSARLLDDSILRTTLWTTAVVALLGLLMGLLAFRLITRPLRALTKDVRGFDANGELAAALPVQTIEDGGDEISVLSTAFAQMGRRIAEQWRELAHQDQQRREVIANISHDLRTPLTSLHGYLETLRFKEDSLSDTDRRHYLDIALGQSRKVGRLAQELFDLARLESGLVQPELEAFSLAELVQDVVEKCAPAAQRHEHPLSVEISHTLPPVRGDLGMIERVLTNLLDNAIRHTPAGTAIAVRAEPASDSVRIEVSDTGPGIPDTMRDGLFKRASALRRGAGQNGGLGLILVQRILQLQGSEIRLADARGEGATFSFSLPVA